MNSFVNNGNCAGVTYSQRVDLPDSPRWRQLQGRADAKVWTDDYANVVAAFKWE